MRRGGKTLLCLLAGIALAVTGKAIVNDSGGESGNPYNTIAERNVFDLKPPPVKPVEAPPPTNAPPPNVELTGITTILGNKRALFMVQDPPPPGKPPVKARSCILSEGQRQEGLEVLEITVKPPSVKIKNEGNVSVITFVKHAAPTGPASLPGPGGIPRPPNLGTMHPRTAMNGYNPQVTPTGNNKNGAASYGNPGAGFNGYANNVGTSGGLNNGAGIYNNAANAAVDNGLTPIPTRSVPQQAPAEPPLSREEQYILIEAQRQVNPPSFPPLPPTPLTQNPNTEQPNQSQPPSLPTLPPALQPRTTGTAH